MNGGQEDTADKTKGTSRININQKGKSIEGESLIDQNMEKYSFEPHAGSHNRQGGKWGQCEEGWNGISGKKVKLNSLM